VTRLSTLKDVKAKADAMQPERKDFGFNAKGYDEAMEAWRKS
jgi:hypothetical protein